MSSLDINRLEKLFTKLINEIVDLDGYDEINYEWNVNTYNEICNKNYTWKKVVKRYVKKFTKSELKRLLESFEKRIIVIETMNLLEHKYAAKPKIELIHEIVETSHLDPEDIAIGIIMSDQYEII